jgi:hypothetical protein
MVDRFDLLIKGLFFLLVGGFLVFRRKSLVQGMLDNHKPIFGKGHGSETVNRTVGNIIINTLGILHLTAGLLVLYSAVTGRDWPLHYAKWSDLWPF